MLGEDGWLRYDKGRSIKEKEGWQREGSRHKYQETKKETRRTLREKRVNSNNSYVIVASSD